MFRWFVKRVFSIASAVVILLTAGITNLEAKVNTRVSAIRTMPKKSFLRKGSAKSISHKNSVSKKTRSLSKKQYQGRVKKNSFLNKSDSRSCPKKKNYGDT